MIVMIVLAQGTGDGCQLLLRDEYPSMSRQTKTRLIQRVGLLVEIFFQIHNYSITNQLSCQARNSVTVKDIFSRLDLSVPSLRDTRRHEVALDQSRGRCATTRA